MIYSPMEIMDSQHGYSLYMHMLHIVWHVKLSLKIHLVGVMNIELVFEFNNLIFVLELFQMGF